MSIAAQKTPIAISLENQSQRKVLDAIALLGKALPAQIVSVSGFIVTVKFLLNTSLFTLPQVTIGLGCSQYGRPPMQPGDRGLVFPADTQINEVNGLGSGVADLSITGNLASLTFFPSGSKSFPAPIDANAYEIYGQTGVILHDTAKTTMLKLQPAMGAQLTVPLGKSLQISTLPVSAAGLPVGSLWNSGGTVKVV